MTLIEESKLKLALKLNCETIKLYKLSNQIVPSVQILVVYDVSTWIMTFHRV